MYGETFQEKLKKEKKKAIEIMLTQTGLSIAQIALIQSVSQETILAIQKEMEE